jgi:hypothetical protein
MIRPRMLRCAWLLALTGLWTVDVAAFEMGPQVLLTWPNPTYDLRSHSAAVADANGDGRLDVAVFAESSSSNASSNHVVLLYEQQPDGSMPLARQFSLWPGGVQKYDSSGATMADLDGDGRAEIIVHGAGTNYDHVVILGRGADDSYAEVASLPAPLTSEQLWVRDIDHDGQVDIVDQGSGNYLQGRGRGFAVYRGLGNLRFAAPKYLFGYAGATGFSEGGFGAQLGDIDGDGLDDLLQAPLGDLNEIGAGISYGMGNGVPGAVTDFTAPVFVYAPGAVPPPLKNPAAPNGATAAIGVFPGPGQPRLAIAYETHDEPAPNTIMFHQHLAILAMTDRRHYAVVSDTEFLSGTSLIGPVYSLPVVMRAADIDGDGDDDLVLFLGLRPKIMLQQAGAFGPVMEVPENYNASNNPDLDSTSLADLNGDGCMDLAYRSSWAYVIHYRTDCPAPVAAPATLSVGTPRRHQPPERLPPRLPMRTKRRPLFRAPERGSH